MRWALIPLAWMFALPAPLLHRRLILVVVFIPLVPLLAVEWWRVRDTLRLLPLVVATLFVVVYAWLALADPAADDLLFGIHASAWFQLAPFVVAVREYAAWEQRMALRAQLDHLREFVDVRE